MVFRLPAQGRPAAVDRLSERGGLRRHSTAQTYQQPRLYEVQHEMFRGALEEVLPRQESQKNELLRRIYQFDSISGSTIDLMAMLPYSEFNLTGVDDKEVLKIYEDTLEHLNIETLMPHLSTEFLTIGKVISTLVYDGTNGIFTDVVVQDPDYCTITPIPLQGYDPKIDLRVPPEFRKFLFSKDPRDAQARGEIPKALMSKLLSGRISLEPVSTLYLSRRTYPNDSGTSFLARVIPFYVLEQTLLQGTLNQAFRRQRSILHISAGSDDWEPTETQLEEIIEMFIAADTDPVGAVVATKRDVDVNEIRQGGDFWKVTDEWDSITQAKMRALGINESFLTGDATYNTLEAALSIFLETLRSFRMYMTSKIFYQRIFPTLARVHRFVKRTEAELAHSIRVTGATPVESIPRKDLIIPTVQWHKQLQPQYDQSYLDILGTLDEKVPVPLRVWAAAGGFSMEKLLSGLEEDKENRRKISDYKKEIAAFGGEGEEEEAFAGDKSAPEYVPVGSRRRTRDTKYLIEAMTKAAKADPAKALRYLAVGDRISDASEQGEEKLLEGEYSQ
jgi:hypothetical protein